MSFPLAVLAATAGNLIGSLLAYTLGASSVLAGVPIAGAALRRWQGRTASGAAGDAAVERDHAPVR